VSIQAPVGVLSPDWPSKVLSFNQSTVAFGQSVNEYVGGTPEHDYFFNPSTNSPVYLLVRDINEEWMWFVSVFFVILLSSGFCFLLFLSFLRILLVPLSFGSFCVLAVRLSSIFLPCFLPDFFCASSAVFSPR
jgi:hypothetical protein